MMPMTRMTIIVAIRPGASTSSRLKASRKPSELLLAMMHQQLAGHQAAPRERPALLEPGGERRQRGGQDDVAVGGDALGARAPGPPAA